MAQVLNFALTCLLFSLTAASVKDITVAIVGLSGNGRGSIAGGTKLKVRGARGEQLSMTKSHFVLVVHFTLLRVSPEGRRLRFRARKR